MSSTTSTAHEQATVARGDSADRPADASVHQTAQLRLLKPLEILGFWAGIALPFLYLPLLVTGTTQTELFASVALIAVHAVALYVGHAHDPDWLA